MERQGRLGKGSLEKEGADNEEATTVLPTMVVGEDTEGEKCGTYHPI